jgi:uncharacterized protein YndB with AHSA1/START domain
MHKTIALTMHYPHATEQVWQALTDPHALANWLMENTFEPRVGHLFQFYYRPMSDVVVVIDCEVIAIELLRRLSYTWKEVWMESPSVVTWRLEPSSDGTLLYLNHQLGWSHANSPIISPAQVLAGQGYQTPTACLSSHLQMYPDDGWVSSSVQSTFYPQPFGFPDIYSEAVWQNRLNRLLDRLSTNLSTQVKVD